MKLHSKKGAGAAVMYIAFFGIMFIVAGGIFLGLSAFYGKGYDTRAIESELLLTDVQRCFQDSDFFEDGFDLYSSCGLERDVIEESYVVLVEVEDGSDRRVWGIGDFENQCEFGGEDNSDFPICDSGVVRKGGVDYEILVGSRQYAQEIKG